MSGKTRILIIDDHEPNILLVEAMLSKQGDYEIGVAKNGKEGVKLAQSENWDMILCDYTMPELDGLGVTKALKNDEKTKNIPIVMITADRISVEDTVEALEAGADDYLIRPINPRELVARIHSMVRLKGLRDQIVEAERMEAILQVVTTVNHEINNPLQAALLSLNLLMENDDLEGETKELLKSTEKSLNRIKKITSKLNKASDSVKTYFGRWKMIDLDG